MYAKLLESKKLNEQLQANSEILFDEADCLIRTVSSKSLNDTDFILLNPSLGDDLLKSQNNQKCNEEPLRKSYTITTNDVNHTQPNNLTRSYPPVENDCARKLPASARLNKSHNATTDPSNFLSSKSATVNSLFENNLTNTQDPLYSKSVTASSKCIPKFSHGNTTNSGQNVSRKSNSKVSSLKPLSETDWSASEKNCSTGMENLSSKSSTTPNKPCAKPAYFNPLMEKSFASTEKDMNLEANLRMMTAKLQIFQNEMDRSTMESLKKQEHINQLIAKNTHLEDEKCLAAKSYAFLEVQADKHKKLFEEYKKKSEGLDVQVSYLNKELDSFKRTHKKTCASNTTTETRLNRASDDLEKYKQEITKVKNENKSLMEENKKTIESLTSENKRLETQKLELTDGFKKQLKLIDILKRQKMQLEAARMLQFSEDEFVKILEWYK